MIKQILSEILVVSAGSRWCVLAGFVNMLMNIQVPQNQDFLTS
jgi:hypothetical protein